MKSNDNDEPQLLRIPKTFHTVADLLAVANKLKLPNAMLISERENGDIVLLETNMTCAEANWLMDRVKYLVCRPAKNEKVIANGE